MVSLRCRYSVVTVSQTFRDGVPPTAGEPAWYKTTTSRPSPLPVDRSIDDLRTRVSEATLDSYVDAIQQHASAMPGRACPPMAG